MRKVLRNFNVFVDGVGFAGRARQVNLPDLQLLTEELRAGGLDAPAEMDMGMQAMEASVQFHSVEPEVLTAFGKGNHPLTIRGALQDADGTQHPVVAYLRGRVKGANPGDWTPGQASTSTLTLAVRSYRLEIDGEEVHHIDVDRMVRVIDGEDQLAEIRSAMGI